MTEPLHVTQQAEAEPVVEQIRRDLHDVAEAATEHLDGAWVMTRSEIASRIVTTCARLDALQPKIDAVLAEDVED